MSVKNEKYRECEVYRQALSAACKRRDRFIKINYADPGREIPHERKKRWDIMEPCTSVWFEMDKSSHPCLDCTLADGFISVPKCTPFMMETGGMYSSVYAKTCHGFGLGTGEIITRGQVWASTSEINRILQAEAIVAAVEETGGSDVLIVTDPKDNDAWIRQSESIAELFGRVTFTTADELDDNEQSEELRIVFADENRLEELGKQLNREWDLMIVDHARKYIDPARNEQVFRIGRKAFFRLIIAPGRKREDPRDWFWIYRLADPRIFGNDYDAFLKKYFDEAEPLSETDDDEMCTRLDSIGFFLKKINSGDSFSRLNGVAGKRIGYEIRNNKKNA